MKNIHVIPTDKPSRLHLIEDTLTITSEYKNSVCDAEVNIYITSDEEIKEGDWFMIFTNKKPVAPAKAGLFDSDCKKIILTTDQDLINNGVQSIDDDFLEWFVNHPSCEEVEVQKWSSLAECGYSYKIIIPKEEPKQETLEEAAEKYAEIYRCPATNKNEYCRHDIISAINFGAKWQQERMYSEADNIMKFLDAEVELKLSDKKTIERIKWYFETYFEQFKKK